MTVRIICHMISSIDGKLLPSQWSKALSPIDISAVYEKVASSFEAQGWMIGRKTMAEYDAGVHEKQPATMDCTLGKTFLKVLGTIGRLLLSSIQKENCTIHMII